MSECGRSKAHDTICRSLPSVLYPKIAPRFFSLCSRGPSVKGP